MALQLTSKAFSDGATIPATYTADGRDISPALEWQEVPDGTQAFVLLCLDPDAPGGTFVHWVLYDIPADRDYLEEGIPAEEYVLGTARQGRNDFGKIGYGGPAPPPGTPHRYFFHLYAMDQATGLSPGATQDKLMNAVAGHVLDEGKYMGKYGRT